MNGYAQRLLRIDLTKGETSVRQINDGILINYIGGKGLGAKLFFEEAEFAKDAYDASSLLIFAVGPANGLALSGASKFSAVFKSPLTGMWGESQCGGYFAPHMKNAGYDAIIVTGRSQKPVYLKVDDDVAEIKDAGNLWNLDTFETEDSIKRDCGQSFQVLSIGPAGENLVRYACICHDKGRELGRCGGGAVMGSKKLKAIAVRGTGAISVHEPEKLSQFSKELNMRIRERLRSLHEYGTPNMMSITNATGSLPTRNWREGEFFGSDRIGPETIKKTIMEKSKACFACAVGCRKISKVNFGPYAGTKVEGPEYETLVALGSLCGNDNLESIVKANEICDRLGMDTISAGNVLAFSMECFEKGLLTVENTYGLNLRFADQKSMINALSQIAYRAGFGNVLAEGVKRASEIIGVESERFAVHVKGLEPPGYDPRALKGVALSYAISCRGACHLRHLAHRPNLTGSGPFGLGKVDRLSYEGHGQMIAHLEDFYTVVDSMVLCKFVCLPSLGPIQWEELTTLYNIATGLKAERKGLITKAIRINSLVNLINRKMGISQIADTLPRRFLEEPLENGASRGEIVDVTKLRTMINQYRSARKLTQIVERKDPENATTKEQ